jgi:hypothetical protein
MIRIRELCVCSALAATGCLGEASLDYDRLHIAATRDSGSAIPGYPRDTCTVVPLLLGSRIENRFTVEPPLEVMVTATRDEVQVEFIGALSSESDRTIRTSALRIMQDERLTVRSTSGQAYIVTLSRTCPDLSGSSSP